MLAVINYLFPHRTPRAVFDILRDGRRLRRLKSNKILPINPPLDESSKLLSELENKIEKSEGTLSGETNKCKEIKEANLNKAATYSTDTDTAKDLEPAPSASTTTAEAVAAGDQVKTSRDLTRSISAQSIQRQQDLVDKQTTTTLD